MKVLIAPDKFKGSLSAHEVCFHLKANILSSYPDCFVTELPLADGGDGTLDVIESHQEYTRVNLVREDPLGRKIQTYYLSNGQNAIMELSKTSGIVKLKASEMDVLHTTTLGTGKLVQHAIDQSHLHIILTLGGSCTNEMGMGIAHALGFRFLDKHGEELLPCGKCMIEVKKIIRPRLNGFPKFTILVDVENPLYGLDGAAHVFAAQKGANAEDIELLEQGMKNMAKILEAESGIEISALKGGGAAGGIGAGLKGLLPDLELQSGFDFIAEQSGLEKKIVEADIIITGEGSLDHTSLNGKLVGRLASICGKQKKPLIAIVGKCSLSNEDLRKAGISKVYSILEMSESKEDALKNAGRYLREIKVVL